MRIFLFIVNLIAFLNCRGQEDTLRVKKMRGLLFLSAYNYMYDYNGAQNEIRLRGFHDFFYPVDNIDLRALNSFEAISLLKGGLRVDFFDKRQKFREHAVVMKCKDTSGCYSYEKFYTIPVIASYKQYKDYEPLICPKLFYELKVNDKCFVEFNFLQQAITIVSIDEYKGK